MLQDLARFNYGLGVLVGGGIIQCIIFERIFISFCSLLTKN